MLKSLLAIPFLLSSTLVAAEQSPACSTRDSFVEHLESEYQETSIAGGIDQYGNLVELFIAEDGTTWTLLFTTPKGVTCMITVGESWRQQKAHVSGAGA